MFAALPTSAFAQDEELAPEGVAPYEEPEPSPGGLDIQYPEPRLLVLATVGAGNEYRDRLLSDRNIGSLSAGVAYMGFAASASHSWELSTESTSYEVLFGYSYKLPWIDLHAGYVICGNERMLGGCPDGARVTVTTNSIERTTIEASLDLAVSSSRHTLAASITRDLWTDNETSLALRAGWASSNYNSEGNLEGFSLRLIGARRLNDQLEIDLAFGPIWTSGRAQMPGNQDGFIALTSLVWRN